MHNACGLAVHNLSTSLWVKSVLTHTPTKPPIKSYGKLGTYTVTDAQLNTKLYTFCTQYYDTLVSVINHVVHTIHRAYKEHHELKKGII